MPLVYDHDENPKPVDRYYLSDLGLMKMALPVVANQKKASFIRIAHRYLNISFDNGY